MADELEDQIEAAEEAGDITKLFTIISTCAKHGGDEDYETATEGSLDSLYRLVKSGSAFSIDVLGQIFATLEAWKGEEAIVEVALGCIVAITSKRAELSEEEQNVNVNLIIEVMQSYEGESTIQEQACLAIEGLAKSSSVLKKNLRDIEGIGDELIAAKGRITNERNKKYPGLATAALGIEL